MRWTMKKRRISLIILLLLLSAVCLASLTMAWKEYADQASDRHAFDELAELVEKPKETTVPATETESTDTAEDTTEETRSILDMVLCFFTLFVT